MEKNPYKPSQLAKQHTHLLESYLDNAFKNGIRTDIDDEVHNAITEVLDLIEERSGEQTEADYNDTLNLLNDIAEKDLLPKMLGPHIKTYVNNLLKLCRYINVAQASSIHALSSELSKKYPA